MRAHMHDMVRVAQCTGLACLRDVSKVRAIGNGGNAEDEKEDVI